MWWCPPSSASALATRPKSPGLIAAGAFGRLHAKALPESIRVMPRVCSKTRGRSHEKQSIERHTEGPVTADDSTENARLALCQGGPAVDGAGKPRAAGPANKTQDYREAVPGDAAARGGRTRHEPSRHHQPRRSAECWQGQ